MGNAAATNLNGRLKRRSIGDLLLYGKSMVPALVLLLAILVLFFGLMTKNFFTLGTFKAIISNIPVIAIVSVGMTFVLLIGGLDLSVGSILGLHRGERGAVPRLVRKARRPPRVAALAGRPAAAS